MTMVCHGTAASRLGHWALRHRQGLTLLAAAGPLPYALVRASWLTPSPLLVPSGEALDPETRLWSLLLGGGALLGSVLTIGLLRPWSVTFPRWMPWLAGQPVPVRAATMPGGVVAGVLCAATAPMLQAFVFPTPETLSGQLSLLERLGSIVLFPFWCWGPALALAAWGYALSRGSSTV